MKKVFTLICIFLQTLTCCILVHAEEGKPEKSGADNSRKRNRFVFFVEKAVIQNAFTLEEEKLTKKWILDIGKENGILAEPVFFENMDRLYREYSEMKTDFVFCTSVSYIRWFSKENTRVFLTLMQNNRIRRKYLTLVSSHSYFTDITNLRSKSIAVTKGDTLADLYLDWMLHTKGCETSSGFFRTKEIRDKDSLGVLSCFFGRVDSCIVPEAVFEKMINDNPQLGYALKIIDTSPELIDTVFVVRKSCPQNITDKLTEMAFALHDNPMGKNLFSILNAQKLCGIQEEDIADLRKMDISYQSRITKKNHTRIWTNP